MKRGVEGNIFRISKTFGLVSCLLLFLFFSSTFIAAASDASSEFDNEIKKITSSAEDYETGNIGYVRLQLYVNAVRAKLNEMMGAVDERGGILKAEQLTEVLGEPNEETKWVWVENEQHDFMMKDYVPVWRKIIFDGRKIQIRLEANPSLIKKDKQEMIYRLNFNTEFKKPGEQFDITSKIKEIENLATEYNSNPTGEGAENLAQKSVYVERVFQDLFKKSNENCAELMNKVFGSENKRADEKLVVYEFDMYTGKDYFVVGRLEMCDDCEYQWINLNYWFQGKVKIQDEGKNMQDYKENFKDLSEEEIKTKIKEALDEIKPLLDQGDLKAAMSKQNQLRLLNDAWNQKSNEVWKQVDEIYRKKDESKTDEERRAYNENYGWIKDRLEREALSKKMIKESFEKRKNFYLDYFSGYELKEYYFEQQQWEKRTFENIVEVKEGSEICNNNKDDNNNKLTDCEDPSCREQVCGEMEAEISVAQTNTEIPVMQVNQVSNETRIVETISEGGDSGGNGKVIVSNVVNNGGITGGVVKVDTNDSSNTVTVPADITTTTGESSNISTSPATPTSSTSPGTSTSGSKTELRKMYCINKVCKLKQEVVEAQKVSVCGNHICEDQETIDNCKQDCGGCKEYAAIKCDGKVIFKGEDENGCKLEPICISEETSCKANEDCTQPLCGKAECIEGMCKTIALEECKEAECTDGDKKMQNCDSGDKVIVDICEQGIWKITGASCYVIGDGKGSTEDVVSPDNKESPTRETYVAEDKIANECSVKSDCGGENDVCSNGKCTTIPQTLQVEQVNQVEPQISGESKKNSNKDQSSEQNQESSKDNKKQESSSGSESSPVAAPAVALFRTLYSKFTGLAVDESPPGSDSSVPNRPEQQSNPNPESANQPTEQPNQPIQQAQPDNSNNDRREEENYRRAQEDERRQEEKKQRIQNCKTESEKQCKDRYINPCLEPCMFGDDKQKKESERKGLEECKTICTEKYKQEISTCISDCVKTCDEDKWCQIQWPEGENVRKENQGGFSVGGMCRKSQGKTETNIWFNGWGQGFEQLQQIKNKYYQNGGDDWCKTEYDTLVQKRKEFEAGFNQEFAKWFFEKYLAGSAQEWEEHARGIDELFWGDVEISKRMAETMKCLDKKELPEYNLINFSYESEYGKIQFWEEIREADMFDKGEKTMTIIPYMKIWIFPPKEFIISEMKKAMKNHEFPGASEDKTERKNQGGFTQEEKQMFSQNSGLMNKINKLNKDFGGATKVVFQAKDYTTNEVVFNVYVESNEKDILIIKPMLPEENPTHDIDIEVDFEKIYDMILFGEKQMNGGRLETPPWGREEGIGVKLNDIKNGIQMYFKVRSILNSAKVTPSKYKGDIKSVVKAFMMSMGTGDGGKQQGQDNQMSEEGNNQTKDLEKEVWDSNEKITGEIVASLNK